MFHGIYPILYAFFDAQGRPDRALMRRQVEACLRHGAHGLAVMGLATRWMLPRPTVMGFALRVMGNISDGWDGDAQDRLFALLQRLARAA